MGRRAIYRTGEVDGLEVKVGLPNSHGAYHTFDGHKLTAKEERYVQAITAGKTIKEAAKYAGYNYERENNLVENVAKNPKIVREVEHRMEELKGENIATGKEILEYFTKVMRGEVKDQFGLDAPLGERTSAAKELVKRIVDTEIAGQEASLPEIKVTLNWERNEEEQK